MVRIKKQNDVRHYLPDFRNLGVIFRVILGVNTLAIIAALIRSNTLSEWWMQYLDSAFLVETLLFIILSSCALLRDVFWRLPERLGQIALVAFVSLMTYALILYFNTWWLDLYITPLDPWRFMLLSMLITGILLSYFEIRSRRLSPALTEARLLALTARIRPHFLFNSLNAVLSIIRTDPKQAETTLEELAGLFRVLMKEQHELMPLANEIMFCQQYLDIEKLRLGERLQVSWTIDDNIGAITVPPLMLQPLLENAVFHGIEPSAAGGLIEIRLSKQRNELLIEITNPYPQNGHHTNPVPAGNQLALDNIRERLALYYDLEARLDIRKDQRLFRVRITLPCRT